MRPDLHDTVGYLANPSPSARSFAPATRFARCRPRSRRTCATRSFTRPARFTFCRRRSPCAVNAAPTRPCSRCAAGARYLPHGGNRDHDASPDGIDSRFDFEVTVAMEPGGAFALIVFGTIAAPSRPGFRHFCASTARAPRRRSTRPTRRWGNGVRPTNRSPARTRRASSVRSAIDLPAEGVATEIFHEARLGFSARDGARSAMIP